MNIILVSESVYQGHYNKNAFASFAMTFVINIEKVDNFYYPNNDLSKNETFKQILALAKNEESIIFIGFDYDLMGQSLADSLEMNLLNHGIKNFIRTPYFDDEYICMSEKIDLQKYYEYLYFNQLFSRKHKESLKKILCLEELNNYKEKEFKLLNPHGNSTITYVTQTLLNECI